MTGTGNETQREALNLIWADISAYCKKHGITRDQLSSGRAGVPVDGGKLEARIGFLRLTRTELAQRSGCSPDVITEIVAGQRDPLPALLAQLAQGLRCDPADLLLEEPPDAGTDDPASGNERNESGHSGSH